MSNDEDIFERQRRHASILTYLQEKHYRRRYCHNHQDSWLQITAIALTLVVTERSQDTVLFHSFDGQGPNERRQ